MVRREETSERRCIATGETHPKERLIRFVVGPDDVLTPDLANELPGRGLWVSARQDMVETAVAKDAFSRAAKQKVRIEEKGELIGLLERLLSRRVAQYLGLANKAGLVVTGFNKVEPMLRAGKADLLLGAGDASEDGRRKLAGLRGSAPVVECMRGVELDAALGKTNVVHVGLKQGGLTEKLKVELGRLAGFRTV